MPAGRPTKLTPELIAAVEKHLPVCLYVETVLSILGICRQSFHNWMRRGKAGEPPFDAFVDAVKKGVAKGEMRDLQTVLDASSVSWQAAAWRLERRFPEKWSTQARDIRELKAKVDELLARSPAKPGAEAAPA